MRQAIVIWPMMTLMTNAHIYIYIYIINDKTVLIGTVPHYHEHRPSFSAIWYESLLQLFQFLLCLLHLTWFETRINNKATVTHLTFLVSRLIFWDNLLKLGQHHGCWALAPCVTRSSAAMVLNMQCRHILVFYKDEFQLPVPSWYWGMIGNAILTHMKYMIYYILWYIKYIILCYLKINSLW